MGQPGPIPVEDGSELTHLAWKSLETEGGNLGLSNLRIQALPEFLQSAKGNRTSRAERQIIVDQASLIFEHLYPHMPFKADIYQVQPPSEYLRREVVPNLDTLNEPEFHGRMLEAFSRVRDAHTLYGLPSPYRNAVAFLPFQMRPLLDPKTGWRFFVTAVMHSTPDGGFGHPHFGSGAEITGWGDLSVLAHVERTELHLPGGNYFASFGRGLFHSTLRPLRYVPVPFPDEMPAATIYYRGLGESTLRGIRLPWAVALTDPKAFSPNRVFSMSKATAAVVVWNRYLHREPTQATADGTGAVADINQVSRIPDMFEFRCTRRSGDSDPLEKPELVDLENPTARLGYISIRAFTDDTTAPGATELRVAEFRRILEIMDRVAPDGLVIDIRSNPGGDVEAAERMLQMLTPRTIQPSLFHLANTPAMVDLLKGLKTQPAAAGDAHLGTVRAEFKDWIGDADQMPLPQGPPLSSGQPLTDPDTANDTGQIYHGRGVALLVDALTYSAADIFAGGFQDHSIGPILGTSLLTGGGGANVWSHADLVAKIGPRPDLPLEQLPGDVSISLAIRRSSRVGLFAGQPVEDEGVRADIFYEAPDIDDLLEGHPGLIRRACKELTRKPVFRIDAENPRVLENGGVQIDVACTNISVLKFFLDGHEALAVPLANQGKQTFTTPAVNGLASLKRLRIEGYAKSSETGSGEAAELQLVRVRTVSLAQPEAASADDEPAASSIIGITDPTEANSTQ